MGCVHFILTGNTAKVVGRVCQGLMGPAPQILSLTCLTLWCMLFVQLPFSQVEGAEAKCKAGKPQDCGTPDSSLVQEGDPGLLLSRGVAIPR